MNTGSRICDLPGCGNAPLGDLLYCSDACFSAENDPEPLVLPNRWGGQGSLVPQPVFLPDDAPTLCSFNQTREKSSTDSLCEECWQVQIDLNES